MLFVDFKMAYDSVNRMNLRGVINQMEVPGKLVGMVKVCVKDSKCKVSYGETYSEGFTATGLKQGGSISLAIFNVLLELNEKTK